MKWYKTVALVAAMAIPSLIGNLALAQESVTADTQESGLKLTCGTLQAGGVVSVRTQIVLPDEGDAVTGAWGGLSPELGYFFMDNFELLAGADFGTGFGDLHARSKVTVGFDVGVRYIFGPGPLIYPYLGATYGMAFFFQEVEDDTQEMNIAVPAGILLAINYHVAIDLGIRFLFSRRLERDAASYIEIPAGYFGVQAFF